MNKDKDIDIIKKENEKEKIFELIYEDIKNKTNGVYNIVSVYDLFIRNKKHEVGLSIEQKNILFFEFLKYYINIVLKMYSYLMNSNDIMNIIISNILLLIINNISSFNTSNIFFNLLKKHILNKEEYIIIFFNEIDRTILSKIYLPYSNLLLVIKKLIDCNFFSSSLIKPQINKYKDFLVIMKTEKEKNIFMGQILYGYKIMNYNMYIYNIENIIKEFILIDNLRYIWIGVVIRAANHISKKIYTKRTKY